MVSIEDTLSVQAWDQHQPEYYKYFPLDAYCQLYRWCEETNSSIDLAMASLMSGVSVCAGRNVYLLNGTHKTRGNMYILCNARSGSGKNGAMNLIQDALFKLEAKKKCSLTITDFTPSSLNKTMKENDGSILVSNPEGHSLMHTTLGNKGECYQGFRSRYNDFFSQGNYKRPLSTQPMHYVKDSYLCLLVCMQPDPYLEICDKLVSVKDGLKERILTVCAGHVQLAHPELEPALIRDRKLAIDNSDAKRLPKVVALTLKTVYEVYREPNIPVCMKLTPEARLLLISTTALMKEQQKAANAAIYVAVKQQDMDFKYMDDGGKSAELIGRASSNVAMIDICFNRTTEEVKLDPMRHTVTKAHVQAGEHYIECGVAQSNVFYNYLERKRLMGATVAHASVQRDGSQLSADQLRQQNQGHVLSHEGVVVTSAMLIRKYKMRAFEIKDAFAGLDRQPGDPEYVGSSVKVGKHTMAFYKASPDDVSNTVLARMHISPEAYRLQYAVALTNNRPPGMAQIAHWSEYVALLVANAPIGIVVTVEGAPNDPAAIGIPQAQLADEETDADGHSDPE